MNWQLISFFGDSTVLLPSAAALFIVLMLRKTSRLLAWQWSLLFGITGAIVCASKLAFMGWGLGIRELDFTGFSGHSALSAAFWPIFLWLLSARFSVGLRKAAVITGYVLAAVVGYSRLVIHAHSVSEVIAGLLLGAAGSALFLVLQKRTPDPENVNISWGGVACLVMVPLILLHSGSKALMNPLMILVKIIKLRWIHILSYDQMVSRKINNQTTRCANSIFYTTLFTNSAPNYT
ncbi:phosphatase PAP2 family protein [Klebsiella pneumoniae]|uniref:phosphatase PAP2 family protein n=1 Tax=Klebsiella pneumoniae TaxID=573 RepID=UPI003D666F4A